MKVVHVWDMGLVVRFFYAKGGDQYGAVRFAREVKETAEREQADYVVGCCDPDGPTWRHGLFPQYKAHRNRKDATAILRQQIKAIELLQKFGTVMGAEGFEADDIVASVASAASRDGHLAIVYSGDKDIGQLMLLERVRICDKRFEVTREDVYERFGVQVEQLVDYLAIAGDASDGIPGVPGLGEKAASELLKEHGTLDDAIAYAHSMTNPPARYRKLSEHADTARLCRRLIKLGEREVPLPAMPWRS